MTRAVRRAGRGLGLAALLVALAAVPAAAQALAAAVLPGSRSVQEGVPATAFATILNAGPGTATGCSIAPATLVPADFLYQTTDPETNVLTGEQDEPVDIAAGGGQSFLVAFTPAGPFEATDVTLTFDCGNGDPAPVITGVNTLLLSASTEPVPDIVALAATVPPETGQPAGVVRIPDANGQAAFAVAAVNVGATGTITVSTDTGGHALPLTITLCETVPGTGECVDFFPTPTVDLEIAAGATPTFSVFVQASGDVAFDPASHRIFVRFRQGTATRGATSVAVQTPPRPPDLLGTHGIEGSLTQSGCSGVVSDGTFPVTGALTITAQQDTGPDAATVSGSASLSLGPGRLVLIPTLSGTVTAAGAFDSAFALVGLIPLTGPGSGTGFFPGTGAFQGQVTGDSLALTMTGAFDAPTSCQLQAALSVTLAPAP